MQVQTTGRLCLVRAIGLALTVLAGVELLPAARAQPAPAGAPEVHIGVSPPATPADDATALAEKLQNPVGDLISVPFQNNTNFNVGPRAGTQDILNIQPVIPIHLNEDWNLITRTILPLVWNPSLQPAQSVPFGLAPTAFSAFFSPRNPVNGWIWGAGPVVQLPTITSKTLGSNVWGAGPAFVVVRMDSPWVYGALVNNVFSFGGTSAPGGTRYSVMTVNPFVNYNFGGGWFVGTVPIMTANWDARGTKWTIPIGLQVGPADQDRRQAAGEPAGRRLLQRGASAIRCHLAVAHADRLHLLGTRAMTGAREHSRGSCDRAPVSDGDWPEGDQQLSR